MRVTELPWLPEPPSDYRARCKALAPDQKDLPGVIQHLATHRLNASEANALGKAISRILAGGRTLEPLSSFRLGILANSTYDLVADGLQAAAARHGVALEVVLGAYDSVLQQALDPQSTVNDGSLDAVLIATDHRWFNLVRPALSEAARSGALDGIDVLRAAVSGLRQHGGAPVILQTVPIPNMPLFGSYERRVQGSLRNLLEELNTAIACLAEETGSYLLDVQALAAAVGADVWFDPAQWQLYKLPFSAECNPIYADHVGRLLGAIRGKSRKCLVLDLDNTIWGGVVGDDGIEGLKVGPGTPEGEAFSAVQALALDLRNRGIVLAVCSKNDEATARRVFLEHPDMLLRDEHIAVFQANWVDKANNVEAIAASLSLGLDSLVFLDDNGAERAQLRAALPMVAVPELPADPAWYPWTLSAAGYFEAVTFTEEDRGRAQSYSDAVRRAEVMVKSRDLGDYLSSLQMAISFAPFDSVGRSRISQLINKSNQFNLTTRRYTEVEVATFEADPEVFTLQVRLRDRFGDFGMICVVICRSSVESGSTIWDIDTWLMSCRVLGRKVEEAVLAEIVKAAQAKGVAAIHGRYLPTAKNAMVADHYSKLRFTEVERDGTGRCLYRLELSQFVPQQLPFGPW